MFCCQNTDFGKGHCCFERSLKRLAETDKNNMWFRNANFQNSILLTNWTQQLKALWLTVAMEEQKWMMNSSCPDKWRVILAFVSPLVWKHIDNCNVTQSFTEQTKICQSSVTEKQWTSIITIWCANEHAKMWPPSAKALQELNMWPFNSDLNVSLPNEFINAWISSSKRIVTEVNRGCIIFLHVLQFCYQDWQAFFEVLLRNLFCSRRCVVQCFLCTFFIFVSTVLAFHKSVFADTVVATDARAVVCFAVAQHAVKTWGLETSCEFSECLLLPQTISLGQQINACAFVDNFVFDQSSCGLECAETLGC